MKKNLLICVTAISLLASCKKETLSSKKSNDEIRSTELVKKYGLTVVAPSEAAKIIYTKEFKDFDEFEKFLKMRNNKVVMNSVDGKTTFSDRSRLKTNADTQAEVSGSGWTYSATHNFSNTDAYPNVLTLNWTLNGNVTSQLYYSGFNAGSWAYTQTVGYNQSTSIAVRGMYSESYGVGGFYTYNKLFDYTYYGSWTYNTLTGSQSFTPHPVE